MPDMTVEDAAIISDRSIARLRGAVSKVEDSGAITSLYARTLELTLAELESAMVVLASQAATPDMFADRT